MDLMALRRGLLARTAGRLPLEYQEVEYLESDGNQWISTDLVLKFLETDEFFIRFSILRDGTQIFWGNGNHAYRTSPSRYLQGVRLNGRIRNDLNEGVNGAYYFFGSLDLDTWATEHVIGKSVSCLGVTQQVSDQTQNNTYNMILFAQIEGSQSTNAACRISDCWYKRNNIYLLNLIPCYRKSDSKPGMYDTVTKTFYTNAGAGEFLVGADV
jgi:hypothetical protein